MKNDKKIKPLVIGIGVAGKRHLQTQLDLGINTGIYTTNPQTAKTFKERAGVIVFNNLDKGIEWANLIHICTPDANHTEFVAKALKKRKTVLCEKSFTTSLKDALYLKNLADQYETSLFVGQNYRLTPTFEETRKKVSEGQLGIITHIEATYFHDKTDFKQRYASKYFLYIGGSHAVDLASWITDSQIVAVKASSKNELNYNVNVKFSSGLKGNIKLDASSSRSISGTNLIVQGEKGKLASHNKLNKLSFYPKHNKKIQSKILPNNKTFTIPLEIKLIDDYLLGKKASYWPLPTVNEAVNVIKVLETIKKAASSGRSEQV